MLRLKKDAAQNKTQAEMLDLRKLSMSSSKAFLSFESSSGLYARMPYIQSIQVYVK